MAAALAEPSKVSTIDNSIVYFTPAFYAQILKLNAINRKSYLEGLVIGQLVNGENGSGESSTNRLNDDEFDVKTASTKLNESSPAASTESSLKIICCALLPFHAPFMFYDQSGEVDLKLINNLESYLIAQNIDFQSFKIVGWYKLRRDTPHSMMYSIEKRVCSNMIKRAVDGNMMSSKFLFILNASEESSASDLDAPKPIISEQHQAILYDNRTDMYKTAPINIKNISTTNLRRANETNEDKVRKDADENDAQQQRDAGFMPTQFVDANLKVISSELRASLEMAYKSLQQMCDKLNEKLKSIVSSLVDQEARLLESDEVVLANLEQMTPNDEARLIRVREALRSAVLKSIADELSCCYSSSN